MKLGRDGGGWVEHAHSRQLASTTGCEHTVRYSCSVHTTEEMYRWQCRYMYNVHVHV